MKPPLELEESLLEGEWQLYFSFYYLLVYCYYLITEFIEVLSIC